MDTPNQTEHANPILLPVENQDAEHSDPAPKDQNKLMFAALVVALITFAALVAFGVYKLATHSNTKPPTTISLPEPPPTSL